MLKVNVFVEGEVLSVSDKPAAEGKQPKVRIRVDDGHDQIFVEGLAENFAGVKKGDKVRIKTSIKPFVFKSGELALDIWGWGIDQPKKAG